MQEEQAPASYDNCHLYFWQWQAALVSLHHLVITSCHHKKLLVIVFSCHFLHVRFHLDFDSSTGMAQIMAATLFVKKVHHHKTEQTDVLLVLYIIGHVTGPELDISPVTVVRLKLGSYLAGMCQSYHHWRKHAVGSQHACHIIIVSQSNTLTICLAVIWLRNSQQSYAVFSSYCGS